MLISQGGFLTLRIGTVGFHDIISKAFKIFFKNNLMVFTSTEYFTFYNFS